MSICIGLLIFATTSHNPSKIMNYTFWIPLVVVLLLALTIIGIYNKLVSNKNRMQEAWSAIDVFLKRRFDLVPALVDVVKGYATHEKNLLEQVTRCRTQAMQASGLPQRLETETAFGQAVDNLIVVAESYPDLKANENFLQLQQQLSELENDLAAARRYYNGTVRENNIALESFPSNIVGNLFSFKKGEFFATNAGEKELPGVNF